MNIKVFKLIILVTLLSFAVPSGLYSKKKNQLNFQHNQWLILVKYIITPVEKKIFMSLKNDRDRDAFISLFWKQRDPTKGTPANEFKKEHIRRFEFANKRFGYSSPLPGWKTDRGKYYIILGEPLNREEITHQELNPVLIWEYHGNVKDGTPTAFKVVFYKKSGGGDYRLYIPSVDEPSSLLNAGASAVDITNYAQIYNTLAEKNQEVANVSLSLIPGERVYNFTPSMQSPLLISRIIELPAKRINPSYATDFAKFKGMVRVDVFTSYIGNKADYFLMKDPISGQYHAHIALQPERLSVDYSADQDKYYFNFEMIVTVVQKGKTIFNNSRNFPFYYTKEDLDRQLKEGLIISELVPLIPGRNEVKIILKNAVENDITYYEKKIYVPESKDIFVTKPILTYGIAKSSPETLSAFKVLENILKPMPEKLFSSTDNVYINTFITKKDNRKYNVKMTVTDIIEEDQVKYTENFKIESAFTPIVKKLPKLGYGDFLVKMELQDSKGTKISLQTAPFTVSPRNYIPHPPSAAATIKTGRKYILLVAEADQWLNSGKARKAAVLLEKALRTSPGNTHVIKKYATALLSSGNTAKARTIVDMLKGSEKFKRDYFLLSGKIYFKAAKFSEALNHLIEAHKLQGADYTHLNTIASCYLKLGDRKNALKVFNDSLTQMPDQSRVKEIVKALKKENK